MHTALTMGQKIQLNSTYCNLSRRSGWGLHDVVATKIKINEMSCSGIFSTFFLGFVGSLWCYAWSALAIHVLDDPLLSDFAVTYFIGWAVLMSLVLVFECCATCIENPACFDDGPPTTFVFVRNMLYPFIYIPLSGPLGYMILYVALPSSTQALYFSCVPLFVFFVTIILPLAGVFTCMSILERRACKTKSIMEEC